ncbi:hypothetical protein SAMN05444349_10851 [Bacteroides faecichinchillae]|uniref:Uncharacterized protein n=1 Tax=Bacteroides faecichinchillae TaxID=871325 RepID=A0A1M4XEM5_9BACE|nr:hypothetical protein SAMN05444349_10851 [Bacteroides faecichinchillae]
MFLSFLYLRHNRTTENSFKKGDVIVRITSPFFFSSEKHDAILNQNLFFKSYPLFSFFNTYFQFSTFQITIRILSPKKETLIEFYTIKMKK